MPYHLFQSKNDYSRWLDVILPHSANPNIAGDVYFRGWICFSKGETGGEKNVIVNANHCSIFLSV